MAAPLIQKKTVLTYVGDDGKVGMFMGEIGDGTAPPIRLLLSIDEVEAMGRRKTVTVIIQPCDEPADADSEFESSPAE